MSKNRIPRNGKALAIGGRLKLQPPYAIRVDIGWWQAGQLVRDAKKEGSTYELRMLAKSLEEAMEPFTAKAPTT